MVSEFINTFPIYIYLVLDKNFRVLDKLLWFVLLSKVSMRVDIFHFLDLWSYYQYSSTKSNFNSLKHLPWSVYFMIFLISFLLFCSYLFFAFFSHLLLCSSSYSNIISDKWDNGEDLWQWLWLKIKLNTFRWSTIP